MSECRCSQPLLDYEHGDGDRCRRCAGVVDFEHPRPKLRLVIDNPAARVLTQTQRLDLDRKSA